MSFYWKQIEILPECKMKKILQPGIYPLMNIRKEEEEFFGKNIMVSAIVGMNGCGKSSLLEIAFRMINNVSAFISKNIKRHAAGEIFYVKDIWADLYYQMDGQDGILRSRGNSMALEFGDKKFRFGDQCPEFEDSKYTYYEKMKAADRIAIMQCFFYTVVSNYSLQAYNESDYIDDATLTISNEGKIEENKGGIWVRSLFHKNDGYSSNINLNPFRNGGIIDMQKETELTRNRMAAILIDSQRRLGAGREFIAGYELNKIIYSLDTSTFKNKFEETTDVEYASNGPITVTPKMTVQELVAKFRNHLKNQVTIAYRILEVFSLKPKKTDTDLKVYGYLYIVYKVLSIASKYPAYSEFKSDLGNTELCFQDGTTTLRTSAILLAKKVKKDHSHITTKVEQTLHYLDKLTTKQESFFEWTSELNDHVFNYDQYSGMRYNRYEIKGDPTVERLMRMLPPPFFSSAIYLQQTKKASNSDTQSEKANALIKMENMSAGERQFYYAISTLVYHVMNIKSVPKDRIHYHHITLVLDEIELCFHPEYQRTFIARLINLIKRLGLNEFLSFHIIVTTHSPFILSDIPMENILYLKQGVCQDNKDFINPFGANINDIINQSFFLENGFMGEFAQEKIKSLIDFLTNKSSLMKESDESWDMDKAKWMIEKIGEPLISRQLWTIYDKKFADISQIQKEIDDLEQRKKELEKRKKKLEENN